MDHNKGPGVNYCSHYYKHPRKWELIIEWYISPRTVFEILYILRFVYGSHSSKGTLRIVIVAIFCETRSLEFDKTRNENNTILLITAAQVKILCRIFMWRWF